jgi:osmotically-inducible protein OsmY
MFRKPPSKLEVLQDNLVDVLDNLRDAVADLPVDRVGRSADHARNHLGETVSHGWEAALRKAGDAVSVASDSLHHATSAVGHAAGAVGTTVGGVAHAASERISDTFGGAASRAGDFASHARESASHLGSVAAEAGGTARERAQEKAHQAREAALHAREAAMHAAEAARNNAGSVAGSVAERARGVAGGLSDRVHGVRHQASVSTVNAAERAGSAAAHAHDVLDDAHESLFNRLTHAGRAAHQASETAQKAGAAAGRAAQARAKKSLDNIHPTQIVVEDSSSRWLWIGVGLLAGAIIAMLLAPSSGRRNRALVADKLSKARKSAGHVGEVAASKATDLKKKAEGALHERRTAGAPDDADDLTIADRVRTTLGEAPATRNLERLNVDCVNGLVTLRGPVADAALQAEIEKVVRSVRGVKDVKLDLLLEESGDDSPTFIG